MNRVVKEWLLALAIVAFISVLLINTGNFVQLQKLILVWIVLAALIGVDSLLCAFVAPKFYALKYFSVVRFIAGMSIAGLIYAITYFMGLSHLISFERISAIALGVTVARILFFPCGKK